MENVILVFVQLLSERLKNKQIQVKRRAEEIFHGRVHNLFSRQCLYIEREKRIIAAINDRDNRSIQTSNILFLKGIAQHI